MNRRLGIIFILIAVLFFVSCGIPSIYVPNSSDISINKSRVYINQSVINSSLVRSDYPTLNLLYQIVPVGISPAYPSSTIINSFKNDYCANTSGRLINKRNNRALYTSEASTTIDGASVKPVLGLYQFTDKTTGETINIPVHSLDTLVDNQWEYTFSFDNEEHCLNLSIITAQETKEFKLNRYNGSSFINSEFKYISNEIPADYEITESNITDYELHVYGVVTLQFNNYNNIYNTQPVELYSVPISII